MRSISRAVLTVGLAVLALAAGGVASASASQLYMNGAALKGSAALSSTTKVEEAIELSEYNGNSEEPKRSWAIKCTSVGLEREPEITAPATLEIGDFLLKGCTVTYPSEKCKVEGGEIGTNPIKTVLSLGTSGEDSGEFAPLSSDLWTYLEFKGCILEGGSLSLIGKLPVKLPTGQTETPEQELTFSKTAGLSISNEPVYLTGKVKVKLTSGDKWSFH